MSQKRRVVLRATVPHQNKCVQGEQEDSQINPLLRHLQTKQLISPLEHSLATIRFQYLAVSLNSSTLHYSLLMWIKGVFVASFLKVLSPKLPFSPDHPPYIHPPFHHLLLYAPEEVSTYHSEHKLAQPTTISWLSLLHHDCKSALFSRLYAPNHL
ncbi:uncharacterized protein BDR25DRAFT_361970 [Lindgomyces ingoldianus]|uniref:Uncharacterized protein n=1 Tax=Lindgomyces ingoldianus TaxID=673940 RepID=A0ACB6QAT0_9PLEO|nr:uncharacterized protein BDR25DRAFT_361970 [Lindgomyces ingoldianus]KAF2464043.1 hypothetical protein BDR25DRAFT_361970 [Lindgomyces ingoldianus]